MLLERLSNQEIAILLATKASENAQTLQELAMNVEIYPESVKPVLALLARKGILEPYKDWDGTIRYLYPDNDYAQSVYNELYGSLK